jgi:hypothetical protein
MPELGLGCPAPGLAGSIACLPRGKNNIRRHDPHVQVLNFDMVVLDGEAETLKKNEDGTIFYRGLRSPVAEYVHAIKS